MLLSSLGCNNRLTKTQPTQVTCNEAFSCHLRAPSPAPVWYCSRQRSCVVDVDIHVCCRLQIARPREEGCLRRSDSCHGYFARLDGGRRFSRLR